MVTALYRRYRPETFSEMIGQSQVTDPLMTALRTGRVGHAYLFSGPRGCGKTTSARILARCLNCAEGPTDTPCGTCPSCVELSRDGGGSLDVIEIDAASHGGVDDARDLRERAVFAPARDRFKIFIIDEAHMVTKEGFNALLKIVEEPPEHVKFIFATTEPDKVIGTIRSRTHHYPFRLIPPAALLDYVQTLCESEGVGVEAGVLPLVVRAGGGSARDTLSILDQLIAGSEGDTVDYERAVGLLGFTHEDLLDEAIAAFGSHDAAAAFGAVDRVVQTGQDPQRFVEDLLERFRDLIVIGATNVDGAAAVFRGVPEDQLRCMFEQSQLFSHGELSRVADTIAAGLDRMRGATAPRLHLELMVARALVAADTAPVAAAPAGAGRPAMNRQAAGQGSGQDRSTQAARSAPAASAPANSAPAASTPAASSAAAAAPAYAAPAASAEPVSFASAAAAARALLSETPSAGPTAPQSSAPESSAPEPPEPEFTAADPLEPDLNEHEQVSAPSDAAELAGAGAPIESGATADANSPAEPEGTIEQIRDAWAQILQSVLGANRIAWLASRAVNPLALLKGGMLGVAFDSQTERDVFLSGNAQPALAAAIESVTGIAVRRYHPRGTRPGDLPRPATESDSDAAPHGDASAADASAADSTPSVPSSGASAPASGAADIAAAAATNEASAASAPAARGWPAVAGLGTSSPGTSSAEPAAASAPEPVLAAAADTATSDFPEPDDLPEPPEPDDGSEPPYEVPEPLALSVPATALAALPASAAPSAPSAPASATSASAASAPATSATAAAPSSGPSFTRYGEAVVREVLGATFLEELPRDDGTGR